MLDDADPLGPSGVLIWWFAGGALAFTGCHRGQIEDTSEGPSRDRLVAYYSPLAASRFSPSPSRAAYDDDAIPDGIGVSLRPLDGGGDRKGLRHLHFELFAYKNALGSHRGQLVQTWTQQVRKRCGSEEFWERDVDL